jgi:Ca2+/H+ antiporter, TMEM165/GDT1 family
MKARWVKRGVVVGIIAFMGVAVFGFIVMSLWNWLGPAVFGLRTITFWQALGILILSKILFGGFRGGPGNGGHWRRRMKHRWQEMTPEERAKFREGIFSRYSRPHVAAEESPGPRQV